MLKARTRPSALSLSGRRADLRRRPSICGAHEVSVQPVPEIISAWANVSVLDLAATSISFLMRQDPPFDLGYISAPTCSSAPGRDAGGQRPGSSPQCTGEAVGAGFRTVHATDRPDALAWLRPQISRAAWRSGPQTSSRQCRQSGVQGRARRRQPCAVDGAVQHRLSRAARLGRCPGVAEATKICWSTAVAGSINAGQRGGNSSPTRRRDSCPRSHAVEREICAQCPDLKRRGLLFVARLDRVMLPEITYSPTASSPRQLTSPTAGLIWDASKPPGRSVEG